MARKFLKLAGRRKLRNARGSVQVRISLMTGGKYTAGNVSKTVSIRAARVTDVYNAVYRALLGE